MIELFVISLLGVVLGVSMIWIAHRNRNQRIQTLELENEMLKNELDRR